MGVELRTPYPNELYHHGIKGMHWGKRRFQNKDGSLTAEGERRYGTPGASGRKKTYSENTGSMKVDKSKSAYAKRRPISRKKTYSEGNGNVSVDKTESAYKKRRPNGRKKTYSEGNGNVSVDKSKSVSSKPVGKSSKERGKRMVEAFRKNEGSKTNIDVKSVDKRFTSKLAKCGINWDKYKDTYWYENRGPAALADDLGWNLIEKKRTSPEAIENLVDYYQSEYDMDQSDARKIVNMYLSEMKRKNNTYSIDEK